MKQSGGAKTKLQVGKSKLTPAVQAKKLRDGRTQCRKILDVVIDSMEELINGPDTKPKQKQILQTESENIWFLAALLEPPTETVFSSVPESDYRYHFIYDIPRTDTFDDLAKETFDKLHIRCSRSKSSASTDLFVNQMMTTGLYLYVSSETELVKFLLYISNLAPITTPIPEKVILKGTQKCSVPVLSSLYLHCHLLLLVFGYGKSESFVNDSTQLNALACKAIERLSPCFLEIIQTEIRRSKNVEILLEILWVFLLAQRYISDLPSNFPHDLMDQATYTLVDYENFMPSEEQQDLRFAAHLCQLWLLCDMELTSRKVSLTSPKRTGGRGVGSKGNKKKNQGGLLKTNRQVRESGGSPPGDLHDLTHSLFTDSSVCCECKETKCEDCPCFLKGQKCTNCAPVDYWCLNPHGHSLALALKRKGAKPLASAAKKPKWERVQEDADTRKEKAEREKEKAEREKEQAEREKERKEREKAQAEREKERAEREREQTERERTRKQEQKDKEQREKIAREEQERKAKEEEEKKAMEEREKRAKEEQEKKVREEWEQEKRAKKDKKTKKDKRRKKQAKKKKEQEEREKAAKEVKNNENKAPVKVAPAESSDSDDSSSSESEPDVDMDQKASVVPPQQLNQLLQVLPTLVDNVATLCKERAQLKKEKRKQKKEQERVAANALPLQAFQSAMMARVLGNPKQPYLPYFPDS